MIVAGRNKPSGKKVLTSDGSPQKQTSPDAAIYAYRLSQVSGSAAHSADESHEQEMAHATV